MNTTLPLPDLEKRLQERYQTLVQEHTGQAHATAPGPRLLPSAASAHAAATAACRFYNNPRVGLPELAQPLLDAATQAATEACDAYALVGFDWSCLDYLHHDRKADRIPVNNQATLGYDLFSALLVADRDGRPLAPLCLQLRCAQGLYSSRFDRPRPARSRLDELAVVMQALQALPLGNKRPVFLIDAEADSVYHYRLWDQHRRLLLVRADEERYVRWQGQEWRLPALRDHLEQTAAFQPTRVVDYHGQKLQQYVAEAAVVLDRPACLNREVDGQRKRRKIRGRALPLRLVLAELRADDGSVVTRWYLLSNVPAAVTAATLALWYYWRWKLETYFKLLKSAGQQLEHWQQEDGRRILKRLLVASMACVLAWRLARDASPQAAATRRVVMQLSGRQLEHGQEYTEAGLLAGIWVLLAAVALLQKYSREQVLAMAALVLGSDESCAEPPPNSTDQKNASQRAEGERMCA